MKLYHIVLLVVIAIAVGVIASAGTDASTYVDFETAKSFAIEGSDEKVHVVGNLVKLSNGDIKGVKYHPEIDPNFFQFTLADSKGNEYPVVYHNPKPQDFERSEKIVVIGCVKNEKFIADKILMKCPSKYNNEGLNEVAKAS